MRSISLVLLLVGCSSVNDQNFLESDDSVVDEVVSPNAADVPAEAIFVTDESGAYSFAVWTDPVSEVWQLDPDAFTFSVIPLSDREDEDLGAGIGAGADDVELDLDAHGDEEEEWVEDGPVFPTLIVAYAGTTEIDGWSFDYSGAGPVATDGTAPPPGWSSWTTATSGTKQTTVYNYTGVSAAADFDHKHSGATSYHDLKYVSSFSSCTYAYDCSSTSMSMRWRLYVSIDTDAFAPTYYTYCKKSC